LDAASLLRVLRGVPSARPAAMHDFPKRFPGNEIVGAVLSIVPPHP
jgi:hypothetical protein